MPTLFHCVIVLLVLATHQIHCQVHHFHRLGAPSLHPEHQDREEDTIRYLIVEQMPLFPGCIDTALTNHQKYQCSQRKLQEYILSNLQYPAEAMKENIEGYIVVEFVVELDGRITHIKAINDIGGGCAEEAMRIIESMNRLNARWAPALQRGKPVRVSQRVAVTFAQS